MAYTITFYNVCYCVYSVIVFSSVFEVLGTYEEVPSCSAEGLSSDKYDTFCGISVSCFLFDRIVLRLDGFQSILNLVYCLLC